MKCGCTVLFYIFPMLFILIFFFRKQRLQRTSSTKSNLRWFQTIERAFSAGLFPTWKHVPNQDNVNKSRLYHTHKWVVICIRHINDTCPHALCTEAVEVWSAGSHGATGAGWSMRHPRAPDYLRRTCCAHDDTHTEPFILIIHLNSLWIRTSEFVN